MKIVVATILMGRCSVAGSWRDWRLLKVYDTSAEPALALIRREDGERRAAFPEF